MTTQTIKTPVLKTHMLKILRAPQLATLSAARRITYTLDWRSAQLHGQMLQAALRVPEHIQRYTRPITRPVVRASFKFYLLCNGLDASTSRLHYRMNGGW